MHLSQDLETLISKRRLGGVYSQGAIYVYNSKCRCNYCLRVLAPEYQENWVECVHEKSYSSKCIA